MIAKLDEGKIQDKRGESKMKNSCNVEIW